MNDLFIGYNCHSKTSQHKMSTDTTSECACGTPTSAYYTVGMTYNMICESCVPCSGPCYGKGGAVKLGMYCSQCNTQLKCGVDDCSKPRFNDVKTGRWYRACCRDHGRKLENKQ